jgi:AraC-like DNA-binding protein
VYLLARVVVARNYRRKLTLAEVAGAVSSSPRQIQRAYAQFGELSFHEDLFARRMAAAAQLLAEQPAIAVADVARLVGYRQRAHFARAFRRRFGVAPARFRERARAHRAQIEEGSPSMPAPVAATSALGSSPAMRGSAAVSSAIVSAPASRMRISVPPPAARSAETTPPCCSTT